MEWNYYTSARMELTKKDIAIFEATLKTGNLNIFTNYYFRLPFSGTRYTPEDLVDQYAILHEAWLEAGKPGQELSAITEGEPVKFKVLWEDYSEPVFLLHHGFLLLPWVSDMVQSSKPINVVEGGTGCGKTAGVGIMELAYCALIEGRDFLNVAPTLTQAGDMLGEVTKWVEGTPFEKFVVRPRSGELFKQRPYPELAIQVGQYKSTFGCMTIGKHGNWILGKGKDSIHVDEAGLVDGVGEAIPRLVTRLRGSRRNGKPRSSRMGFSSNPHINPSFDRLVKKAEKLSDDPDSKYFFARPPSTANTAITKRQMDLQLEMLEPADRARWLEGDRSVIEMSGQLSVFPNLCHDPSLDAIMEAFILDDVLPPLAVFEERDGMGVIHWALPPEPMHLYLTIGDPGQANANKMSNNNVPVVIAFDITNFPDAPATVRAFHWIDGRGKYGPWKNCMKECMLLYPGLSCYDGTGTQVAFAEDSFFAGMQLWPVGMGGAGSGGVKALAKTLFKLMAGDKLFAWPYIEGLWHQCAIYREGGAGVKHLADDIVAALFVGAYYLRATFISTLGHKYLLPDERAAETVDESASIGSDTRYRRSTGRYGRGKCTEETESF